MPAATIGTAVTSQNAATTTNTSLVVTLATTTVGELNIIEMTGLANGTVVNPTVTTPTGWTKLGEQLDTNGTPASFVAVYYRAFQSGDASTVTIAWTNQGQMVAVCTPWSGQAGSPIPYSVFDFKVASDVNYSIAGTTSGTQGYLNYGFANRTGTAWSSLSDNSRAQATITSSATMATRVTAAEVATSTGFTKTAVGSNTSVGVSWAYTVAGSSGTNATPAPSTVAVVASVGSSTPGVGAGATPAVVAAVTTVGTAVLHTDQTVTPTTVAAVTTVPALAGVGLLPTHDITFRAAVGNKATSTTPNITIPVTALVGDVFLIHLSQNNTDVITATPSPLVSIRSDATVSTFPTNLYYAIVDNTTLSAGDTLAWTLSVARQWSVVAYGAAGVDLTSPIHAQTHAGTVGTTETAPSITTSITAWLVEIAVGKSNGTTITSWTAPAGWTGRATAAASNTFGGSAYVADRDAGMATAGTYGGETYTPSSAPGATDRYSIALTPSAGASVNAQVIPAPATVGAPTVTGTQSRTVTPAAVAVVVSVGALTPIGGGGTTSTTVWTSSTANPNNQTNSSIALTDGGAVNVDDVLVADIVTQIVSLTPAVVTGPAGWTQIGSGVSDLGTSDSLKLTSWYRVVQAGDVTTRSWTWTVAGQSVGVLSCVRGLDVTGPIAQVSQTAQAASSTTKTAGPVTTSTPQRVRAVFADRQGSSWSGLADTVLATVTNAASLSMVVEDSATAPAAGSISRTATASSANGVGTNALYAYKEAPAGLGSSTTAGLLVKVQGWTPTSTVSGTTTGLVVTFPAAVAGNTLMVAVASENPVTTPAGWNVAVSNVSGAATYLYWKTAAGGETTVTVVPSVASAMAASAAEYKGPVASPVETFATGSGATSVTAGPIVTANPADLLVAVFGFAGTAPNGIGNPSGGFTEETDTFTTRTSGTDVDLSVATQRAQMTAVFTTTATATGTVTGGAGLIAAFKLSLNDSQPMPPTVPVVGTVPAPIMVVQVDRTVTPPTIPVIGSVPNGVIVTPGLTVVRPATIQLTTTTTSIVGVVAHSTVTPVTVPAPVAVPIPPNISGVTVTVVITTAVAAVATVGAPSLLLGASTTPQPGTVNATVAVLGPDLTTGTGITTAPDTITATTTVSSPLVAGNSVAFRVATIPAPVTVGTSRVVIGTVLYLFRTPIRQPEGPRLTVDATPAQRGLMRHFHIHGGYPVAVLITGTTVTELSVPTTDDIANADYAYLGGRDNVVAGVQAQLLAAAGYDLQTIG